MCTYKSYATWHCHYKSTQKYIVIPDLRRLLLKDTTEAQEFQGVQQKRPDMTNDYPRLVASTAAKAQRTSRGRNYRGSFTEIRRVLLVKPFIL